MKPFDQLSIASALPVVNLEEVKKPFDGWLRPLSTTCEKHLNEGTKCLEYYLSLQGKTVPNGLHHCPFGFSTVKFNSGNTEMAVTGFVATPRTGDKKEKIIANRHSDYKYSLDSVDRMIHKLRGVRYHMEQLEVNTIKNHSMALHEVRKLNKLVVQNAERNCNEESPQNPEGASKRSVTIWKAATLMSQQFDVIEILANEKLTELPLNNLINPYGLFYKCVKIYETLETRHKIKISGLANAPPKIHVCDKTFSIIPTVLIENALKYAVPNSEVQIKISLAGRSYLIMVANESKSDSPLTDEIFKRGVRQTTRSDGSGNGLYIAKLIADQHGGQLSVVSQQIGEDLYKHIFKLQIDIAQN